jgi:hypothetical protein
LRYHCVIQSNLRNKYTCSSLIQWYCAWPRYEYSIAFAIQYMP